ncbi:MAG: nucleotidyltransferase domain-containing protein [Cyanobacteria bacterium J06638_6]
MSYGLSNAQMREIIQFVATYPDVESAILCSSRALGTHKPASDVDIALKGKAVSASLAARPSSISKKIPTCPTSFDFVAYPIITRKALKQPIDSNGVLIYECQWS